jgi:transglutaminase-like putative cysteine protease
MTTTDTAKAPLAAFLCDDEVLELTAPELQAVLRTLGTAGLSRVDAMRATFEWVRDRVPHSVDIGATELTCSARDVLARGHGLCFAKSNLLVSLLRAQGFAAGFGYQRLRVDETPSGFGLHGFVQIFIPSLGRFVGVDPRGNNARVSTSFDLERPCLAFVPNAADGEETLETVWPAPSPAVTRLLRSGLSVEQAIAAIPDVP